MKTCGLVTESVFSSLSNITAGPIWEVPAGTGLQWLSPPRSGLLLTQAPSGRAEAPLQLGNQGDLGASFLSSVPAGPGQPGTSPPAGLSLPQRRPRREECPAPRPGLTVSGSCRDCSASATPWPQEPAQPPAGLASRDQAINCYPSPPGLMLRGGPWEQTGIPLPSGEASGAERAGRPQGSPQTTCEVAPGEGQRLAEAVWGWGHVSLN